MSVARIGGSHGGLSHGLGSTLKADPFTNYLYKGYKKVTKKPELPEFPEQQKVEPVQQVIDNASDTKRRLKKPRSRNSALLSGVSNALKKKLGE